ncbi:ATP-binding protein [Streptomyces sulfonofaciens]|uniref:ATP-binding protein n=1 Tax=Streptomyces sulfonofaciens TaxID=68272 RepID=A0A919GFL1_9ACTN|nr:ATP-binding protein [Streptomyces sulfonofaciens]GHH83174.1 ATP-binding protein [Streptomyces sulfonofaciens]
MTGADAVDIRWQLPRTPRSAGRARALLRSQLAAWGIAGEPAETAELLLSELVTNAVRHAGTPRGREIAVRLARYEGRLRVEVADADDRRPLPRTADLDDTGGRGLRLVHLLAERWGCCPRRYGIGKAVWAEVGTGEPVSPAPGTPPSAGS